MKIFVASGIFLLLFINTSFCGVIKNDTQHEVIFGGDFANIYEAPYHVVLIFNGNYICGGALITFRHVLTAAHCLVHKARNPRLELEVIAGTDSQDYRGDVRYASSVYIHPRFGGREVSFDVGIIVLNRPFSQSQTISTVSLPKIEAHVGDQVRITGFGAFTYYRKDISHNLKKFYTEIIDCYQYIPDEIVRPGDLCTRSDYGQGICFGDSGSPLVNSKGEVVGVASRVFGCGDGTPDVYSYIYYYTRYINSIVSQTGGFTNEQKFEHKDWNHYKPEHQDTPLDKKKENEIPKNWWDQSPQGHKGHLGTDGWWNENGVSEPEYFEYNPHNWFIDDKGHLEKYSFVARTKNNGMVSDKN